MLRILKIDFAQTDRPTDGNAKRQTKPPKKNGHNYGVPHHQRHELTDAWTIIARYCGLNSNKHHPLRTWPRNRVYLLLNIKLVNNFFLKINYGRFIWNYIWKKIFSIRFHFILVVQWLSCLHLIVCPYWCENIPRYMYICLLRFV